MKKKNISPSLKGLSRRDLRIIRLAHQHWRKEIKAHLDAIRRSQQITGDDLKIIVR